jgi:hypothetical protein
LGVQYVKGEHNFIDMTGWVMAEHGVPDSRLKVIEQDKSEQYSGRGAFWICECSCEKHNKIVADGTNIRNGNTKSCGCLNKERIINFNKSEKSKRNKYSEKMCDEHGEYYIGSTTNTNREFYVDADDYDKIKDYCWIEHISQGGYCALEAREEDTNKVIRMHYLIVGKNFDHEDRNPFNNRKYNLRNPGKCGNAQNHSLRKDNSTGVSGVNFDKRSGRYISRIQAHNKRILLGQFVSLDDAIKARLNAEIKYYGTFAPQKHLFKQYGIQIKEDKGAECIEI